MLILTMPINQVSELLKVSDLAIPDLPTATYKSFYTITFQNKDAIGYKPVLKNDFAPWICNNLFKGLSTDPLFSTEFLKLFLKKPIPKPRVNKTTKAYR